MIPGTIRVFAIMVSRQASNMAESIEAHEGQEAAPAETSEAVLRGNPRARAWVERALLAILLVGFIVEAAIPAWNHLNSDFRNYYLVARLYHQGYPLERVYEWVWLQRQWDHISDEHGLVSYQPLTLLSALPVAPLSNFAPLTAKRWWLLLNVVFLGLTALLLIRCTSLGWIRVLLVMFLAFFPLRSNFVYGQMHVLLLLVLTIGTVLYLKNQYFWSGILLAIGAALKIYPALFLLFFVIKRRWSALAGLGAGLGASILLSISLFGMDACRTYAQEILPWAMRSQIINPYNVGWGSLNALLMRLFIAEPELNPSPVAHLPWLYALLYSLLASATVAAFVHATGFGRSDRTREELEWANWFLLLLLVSSQPAPYHFVVLILPAVLFMDYLTKRGETTKAAIFVLFYIFACGPYARLQSAEPIRWHVLLYFPRLVFLLAMGGLSLSVLHGSAKQHPELRLRTQCWVLTGLAFCTLFTASFLGSLTHLRGQFDNYASRVITVANSATAGDPVFGSGGLFFTALVPRFLPSVRDLYAVHQLKDGSVASFATSGDWFHPAVGVERNNAWAEVAANRGSRIVHFLPDTPLRSIAQTTVVVNNAEQPVISSDGTLLAYLREVQGKNSLWVRRNDTKDGAARIDGDREIASSEYDVREAAFFPDHRIVFSARREGRFRLFVVKPGSAAVEQMPLPSCSARYPAVSLDGKSMAFSCEQRGYWQLHVMDLNTSEQHQQTNSECNAFTPAWTLDSRKLIYATDCGRGLGMTALVELNVDH